MCNCCSECKVKIAEIEKKIDTILKQTNSELKHIGGNNDGNSDTPVRALINDIEKKNIKKPVTRSQTAPRRNSIRTSNGDITKTTASLGLPKIAKPATTKTATKIQKIESTIQQDPKESETSSVSPSELTSKSSESASMENNLLSIVAASSTESTSTDNQLVSIVAARKRKDIYVTGLDLNIPDHDFRQCVFGMIPDASCYRIIPKPSHGNQPHHLGYRIQVPEDKYDVLFNLNWPKGITVTEFKHRGNFRPTTHTNGWT